MWEPARDFASLKLPTSGARTVVALSGFVLVLSDTGLLFTQLEYRTMPQVMVISSEGCFYSYSIDLEKGGECTLLKQYSLFDSADESSGLVDWHQDQEDWDTSSLIFVLFSGPFFFAFSTSLQDTHPFTHPIYTEIYRSGKTLSFRIHIDDSIVWNRVPYLYLPCLWW